MKTEYLIAIGAAVVAFLFWKKKQAQAAQSAMAPQIMQPQTAVTAPAASITKTPMVASAQPMAASAAASIAAPTKVTNAQWNAMNATQKAAAIAAGETNINGAPLKTADAIAHAAFQSGNIDTVKQGKDTLTSIAQTTLATGITSFGVAAGGPAGGVLGGLFAKQLVH